MTQRGDNLGDNLGDSPGDNLNSLLWLAFARGTTKSYFFILIFFSFSYSLNLSFFISYSFYYKYTAKAIFLKYLKLLFPQILS